MVVLCRTPMMKTPAGPANWHETPCLDCLEDVALILRGSFANLKYEHNHMFCSVLHVKSMQMRDKNMDF